MLGGPFHPVVVHFPIALYLLGVLFSAGFLWRRSPDYDRFAYWAFVLAWISVGVAAVVGLVDMGALAPGDPRRISLNNHITAGVGLLVINGLLVYYRFRWANVLTSARRWQYLALMAVGVVVLVITGWLGGDLVYNLKVGVN
jgi:uncharacterized membrane protein